MSAKKQGYPTSPVAKRPRLITRLKLYVSACVDRWEEGGVFFSICSISENFFPSFICSCMSFYFFFKKTQTLWLSAPMHQVFLLVFIFMRALSVGCPWLSSTNLPLKVLLLAFASVGHPPCEKVGGLPPKLGLPGGPPPTQEKAHDEGFALMI